MRKDVLKVRQRVFCWNWQEEFYQGSVTERTVETGGKGNTDQRGFARVESDGDRCTDEKCWGFIFFHVGCRVLVSFRGAAVTIVFSWELPRSHR